MSQSHSNSDTSDLVKYGLITNTDEGEHLECGYGNCSPKWLQRCNVPKGLLLAICSFMFVQGFVVNGINNVNTTTIERRFELPSSGVAWISSVYDLSGGVFALIFGYFGMFHHHGRTLAIGAVVMAFGSFTMSLPHWLSGNYILGQAPTGLCDHSTNNTAGCSDSTRQSMYIYLFLAGQILHGVGGGALYTLANPYIDENIQTKNTPVYIGLMQSSSALGPAMGYLLGGYLLSFYVDVLRVDTDQISIEHGDPRWVGAWWVGFTSSGFAFLLAAFFLGMFPRELPVAKVYRKDRQSQAYKGIGEQNTTSQNGVQSFKQAFISIKLFLTNPTWMFLTVGAIFESGAVMGFATFLPKVVQFQFNLPGSTAAMLAGLLVVPGVTIGNIVGGLIPRCLHLRLRGLLIQCAACSIIGIPFALTFLLRCDVAALAGFNVEYLNTSTILDDVSIGHSCNSHCQCTTSIYDPICGSDNVGYFSPCYAGCNGYQEIEKQKTYYNCSCIPTNTSAFDKVWPDARAGVCDRTCSVLPYFLGSLFIFMVIANIASTAGQSASLRCVADKQRAFAGGIQSAMIRLLGNVPGPLLLGVIFDKSCVVWQDKCDSQASCWIYDGKYLAVCLCIVIAVIKTISTLCFILALVLYKPPPDKEILTTMVIARKYVNQDGQVNKDNISPSSVTSSKSKDDLAVLLVQSSEHKSEIRTTTL